MLNGAWDKTNNDIRLEGMRKSLNPGFKLQTWMTCWKSILKISIRGAQRRYVSTGLKRTSSLLYFGLMMANLAEP